MPTENGNITVTNMIGCTNTIIGSGTIHTGVRGIMTRTTEGIIDRKNLLSILNSLLSVEFEKIVFEYGVPPEYLSNNTHAQRAMDVIRYAESRNELDTLHKIIERQICLSKER